MKPRQVAIGEVQEVLRQVQAEKNRFGYGQNRGRSYAFAEQAVEVYNDLIAALRFKKIHMLGEVKELWFSTERNSVEFNPTSGVVRQSEKYFGGTTAYNWSGTIIVPSGFMNTRDLPLTLVHEMAHSEMKAVAPNVSRRSLVSDASGVLYGCFLEGAVRARSEYVLRFLRSKYKLSYAAALSDLEEILINPHDGATQQGACFVFNEGLDNLDVSRVHS